MNLTVISITYNNYHNLLKTYESLKNQSDLNFKWLVVDGGSKDETLNFLNTLEAPFEFNFISENDSGIYDAMNKGASKIKDGYIWYLNAGDITYNSNSISIINNNLSGDICIFRVAYERNGKIFFSNNNPTLQNTVLLMPVCHQGIIYSKNALRNGFNLKYKIAADQNHLIKCIQDNMRINPKEDVIATFDTTGISSNRKWTLMKEFLISNLETKSCSKINLAHELVRRAISKITKNLSYKK
jgi:glycosyltransferase involved in cell wall biosynthesis